MNESSATDSPVLPFGFKLVFAALLPYLAAILVLGKGPTYIGVPPVFWGEVALAFSLMGVFLNRSFGMFTTTGPWKLTLVIVGFQLIGAIETSFGIPRWGLDAVRDAAIWYYSLFYFVGLALAESKDIGDRVSRFLLGVWIAALLWGAADFASGHQLSRLGPVTSRGASILSNSGSEMVQNMILGSVVVLGLGIPSRPKWAHGVLVFIAVVGMAAGSVFSGRGVKIALVAAFLVGTALILSPDRGPSLSRRLATLLFIMALFVLPIAFLAYDNLYETMNLDRFEAGPNLPGTTSYWRQIWWQALIDEVWRRDPVFGLGFGENLGGYHPSLSRDHLNPFPLRAPHNFNVTIVARMGMVGLILWMMILILGLGRLFASQWRPRADAHRSELGFFLMMLVATWLNATFGVLMEGPVLGIPFWFILGFASGREISTRDIGAPTELRPIEGGAGGVGGRDRP